ncbi:MAG: phage virion morphogenesis protein [Gammaproteobacteria bacterium]|nr:phage virion morphogenesis protein [Gammaproteobacteria bacterium]
MIHIEVDDRDFQHSIKRLRGSVNDKKLWAAMGEKLLRTHRKRFLQEKSPEGYKWKERSAVSEKIRARGKPKPKHHSILKHQGRLAQTLRYQASHSGLLLGSDLPYAAIHQFGGKFKMFGKHTVEMPARPFLGVSKTDGQMIERLIVNHLAKQIR